MELSSKWTNIGTALLLCLPTAGCGLRTPDMVVLGDTHATSDLVLKIMNHVEDELGCAIVAMIKFDKNNAIDGRAFPWLDRSVAKIALKLTVDEKSTLNAGLNYTDFFTNAVSTIGKTVITTQRSFMLGANIGGSSDATRIDNSDYSFSVADAFVKDKDYSETGEHCTAPHDGVLMDSDLHINDWLDSRLRQYILHPEAKRTAPNTLTTEITFVVAYNGNVTPNWHLVPTSFNTGTSPFFNPLGAELTT
jgi:hypothetical protein